MCIPEVLKIVKLLPTHQGEISYHLQKENIIYFAWKDTVRFV